LPNEPKKKTAKSKPKHPDEPTRATAPAIQPAAAKAASKPPEPPIQVTSTVTEGGRTVKPNSLVYFGPKLSPRLFSCASTSGPKSPWALHGPASLRAHCRLAASAGSSVRRCVLRRSDRISSALPAGFLTQPLPAPAEDPLPGYGACPAFLFLAQFKI
jgi:hypothetical protein